MQHSKTMFKEVSVIGHRSPDVYLCDKSPSLFRTSRPKSRYRKPNTNVTSHDQRPYKPLRLFDYFQVSAVRSKSTTCLRGSRNPVIPIRFLSTAATPCVLSGVRATRLLSIVTFGIPKKQGHSCRPRPTLRCTCGTGSIYRTRGDMWPKPTDGYHNLDC